MASELHKPKRMRTKAQISFNMSRVRSTGSKIEQAMEAALLKMKLRPIKHPEMFGRPDFVFPRKRVAIFCDSHFWHGYNWKVRKQEIRRNRLFWVPKILSNIRRDRLVNRRLREEGWAVLRFWEHQILGTPERCAALVKQTLMGRKTRVRSCR
jgi:DNA mismatch endonuclease Vsr